MPHPPGPWMTSTSPAPRLSSMPRRAGRFDGLAAVPERSDRCRENGLHSASADGGRKDSLYCFVRVPGHAGVDSWPAGSYAHSSGPGMRILGERPGKKKTPAVCFRQRYQVSESLRGASASLRPPDRGREPAVAFGHVITIPASRQRQALPFREIGSATRSPQKCQAGLLTRGSSLVRAFPQSCLCSGCLRIRSPLTVAGPRRPYTGFPILPLPWPPSGPSPPSWR